MSEMQSDWSEKKVVIIGAARQGTALAHYLAQQGAFVTLTDRRPLEELSDAWVALAGLPVRWACGGHPLSLLEGIDLLCVSGGVPLSLPLVQAARARGIPLSNDSQIFLQAVPCRVIGITGSAGKTTTTTLVGRMAQAFLTDRPERAWVGGNIGTPLIGVLEDIQAQDLAVMELSSFQLELMDRSPQVAALLNLTPNHLDRHGSMQAYTAAKARILDFQSPQDIAILNREDSGAWALASRVRGRLVTFGWEQPEPGLEGTFLRQGKLFLRTIQAGQVVDECLLPVEAIRLRGEHNRLNVLAACAIAAAAGFSPAAMLAGVQDFYGVEHRLQFVRSWHGADWYNDSIATAPERAMAAIRSFEEPLILLAGGRDKDLPWEDFAELVSRRVDHLILFGEAAEKILRAFPQAQSEVGDAQTANGHRFTWKRCPDLQAAVQAAAHLVEPGDVVLLSPGATSFDQFIDFQERGECFVRLVMHLA